MDDRALSVSQLDTSVGTSLHLYSSGNQRDAPSDGLLQLIQFKGLHRYGYYHEALELAGKFISLVIKSLKTRNLTRKVRRLRLRF